MDERAGTEMFAGLVLGSEGGASCGPDTRVTGLTCSKCGQRDGPGMGLGSEAWR